MVFLEVTLPTQKEKNRMKHNWKKTVREIAHQAGYEPNAWFETQMVKTIEKGIKDADFEGYKRGIEAGKIVQKEV